MTDKEQAWEDAGGANPKCDACGERIFKKEGNRPFQLTELAQAGYFNVVCVDCADEFATVSMGKAARLLNQIAKRSLP